MGFVQLEQIQKLIWETSVNISSYCIALTDNMHAAVKNQIVIKRKRTKFLKIYKMFLNLKKTNPKKKKRKPMKNREQENFANDKLKLICD